MRCGTSKFEAKKVKILKIEGYTGRSEIYFIQLSNFSAEVKTEKENAIKKYFPNQNIFPIKSAEVKRVSGFR